VFAMLKRFRTLRFRLAALYLVVSAAIIITVCVILLRTRERFVHADFDQRLVERAYVMVGVISSITVRAQVSLQNPQELPRLNPFQFPEYYFQLRNKNGLSIECSDSLEGGELPFREIQRAARASNKPVLETLRGEMSEAILGAPGELRLLTLYYDPPEREPFYLQVAVDLKPVHESVADIRRVFLFVVPGGLLLAAGASWLLAARSLSSIGELAKQARSYTAADLGRRIVSPPGDVEVAELADVLNGMLARLEAAFRSQERFIANASHELKTPLSIILAETQILTQKERDADEYEQFVGNVQDQLRQLTRLVDSLLTLSRADAGFPLAIVQPVSLNDVVIEAVQRCEPLARHRLVRLVPRLALPTEEGAEPIIHGDQQLLRVVVENLLRNAVRYSPPEDAVDIEVKLDAAHVCVAVRDNGPGIPPDKIDNLFNRFFQIPRGDLSAHGTGLGLAIAKGVVALHRGTIEVRNRESGGCEFSIRLPKEQSSTIL
jgi:signal transduction histidine kinase